MSQGFHWKRARLLWVSLPSVGFRGDLWRLRAEYLEYHLLGLHSSVCIEVWV